MKFKMNSQGYYIHPFEISFCGFSNTGKTTLIENIIKNLKNEFCIGYLKHDAHSFCIDHPGKDTYRMQTAGASSVLINDPHHHAKISKGELSQVDMIASCIDSDILIIEGHKLSPLPKYLLIDRNNHYEETLQLIHEGKISNIVGIISDHDPLDGAYPVFKRDDIKEITDHFIKNLSLRYEKNVKTLILAGGYSKRMNEDKANIHYFGKNQIHHTIDIVSDFSDDIYISCRLDQLESASFLSGQKTIVDQFPSLGPSSGILSAQYLHPTSPWLIIACDLPYLDKNTIRILVENRNPFKTATCFLNPKRNWPEPLCAIYEPKSYLGLMKYFSMHKPCPRKYLFNSTIKTLDLKNERALDNINTPNQKMGVYEFIKNEGISDGY